MKSFSTLVARAALIALSSVAAAACEPASAPGATPDGVSDLGTGALSETQEVAAGEAHWSYQTAEVAFDAAVVPTLLEVQGVWKTAAWAHSKSGSLQLSPSGIMPEGQSGYQQTYTFAMGEPTCTTTYPLALTTHWLAADGTVSDQTHDLGDAFEAEDAIPENLPLGAKGMGACRYLPATDTQPEQVLCWVRGISSGSVTYQCMVREGAFDKSACKF